MVDDQAVQDLEEPRAGGSGVPQAREATKRPEVRLLDEVVREGDVSGQLEGEAIESRQVRERQLLEPTT